MAFDKERLDSVQRSNGLGSFQSRAFTLYHGINHRGTGDMSPANQDYQAQCFFTKPICNLTPGNIELVRKLQYLTTTDSDSLAAAIKASLYPRQFADIYERNCVRSSVVDDNFPFISFLTNTLLSLSGWPDETTESYVSDEGLAKQVYGWVDDRPNNFGTFDLTATFVNKEGDPHLTLFSAWREYMTRVAEGSMVPFPEFIAEDEIDYMTRVYVVVTDSTRRTVVKIACCGAMYPTAVPTAASFNFTADSMISTENAQIDIPFKAYGALYNDPIIIEDFNRVVEIFNPDMKDATREDNFIKLSPREKQVFPSYGYPRINEATLELEWWVDFETYDLVLTALGVNEDE